MRAVLTEPEGAPYTLFSQLVSTLFSRFRHLRANRKQIVRTLAADSKRSFWAIADQGVVSLGNFSVNMLLAAYFARMRDLKDFGAFGILMELILVLNGLQQAILVYPLTVRGTLLERKALSQMTSMCMVLTIMAWPVMALGMVITALVAHKSLQVGLWAAVAMLLWQIQETLRRALIAQLRFRATILGDAISYLGQIAVVVVLAWMDRLSLVTTFQAMALTSGLAALVQALQVGLQDVKFRELPAFARGCWSLGRWIAFGNLSTVLTGPVFIWNFVYWTSAEIVGIFLAITNLVRLTNPLSFVVATLIMPNAARARAEGGMRRAKMVLLRFGILGGIVLVPYLGLLMVAPEASIRLVYRSGAVDLLPYAGILRIAAIYAALSYIAIASGAFLNSVERSRWTFNAQVWSALSVPLVVMPLTALYHLWGGVIGAAISSLVLVMAHEHYIRKLSDDEPVDTRLPADERAPSAAHSSKTVAV